MPAAASAPPDRQSGRGGTGNPTKCQYRNASAPAELRLFFIHPTSRTAADRRP